MSHAVRIDYENISVQCQSICEMAGSQLCKLDKMLDTIERESSRLVNSQTEALRKEINNTKRQIQDRIDAVLYEAKRKSGMGRVVVDSDFMGKHAGAYNVINEAKELERMVTRLADTKIVEMGSLLNQLLNSSLEKQNEKLRNLASGRVSVNYDVQKQIDTVTDEIIRQYIYLAWVEKPDASFDELYKSALEVKEKADKKQYEKIENEAIEEIKSELRNEKIDEKTIRKVTESSGSSAKDRVRNVREKANAEIVSEKVRKASVKIIVNAIKKRGFIVDSRSVRIDREKNQVNIVAMKPSGARAEFKVYLDGKFEYRFDGYEGQACQNDIKPFMKALEEVYGMKVLHKTELWGGNPDKTSSMKYQAMDYNKNKG